jgi:hypothetical protein
MLTESSGVSWSAGSAAAPCGPLDHSASGQRLRRPSAHVGLSLRPCRAEHVEADAAGDRGQPGAWGCDGVLLPRDMAYQRA